MLNQTILPHVIILQDTTKSYCNIVCFLGLDYITYYILFYHSMCYCNMNTDMKFSINIEINIRVKIENMITILQMI